MMDMSGQSTVTSFTVQFLEWLIKQFQTMTVKYFFSEDISFLFQSYFPVKTAPS